MCWIGNKKEHFKKHIAQEDIKTYKLLRESQQSYFSPCFGMNYKIDEENESSIRKIVNEDFRYLRIEDGLHSYAINNIPVLLLHPFKHFNVHTNGPVLSNGHALINSADYTYKSIYGICIIPKGSEYYFNGLEYVSNRLILKFAKPLSEIYNSDKFDITV